MKTTLKLIILLGMLPFIFSYAKAQGTQRGPTIALINSSGYAKIIPNAQVTLCQYNTANACSVPVTIYKDQALTTAISYPFYANSSGNYTYYAQPGTYIEQVCSPLNQCYYFQITLASSGSGAFFPGSSGFVFNTSNTIARNATASDLAALLSSLTGCSTAGQVYSPASGACLSPGGGGVNPSLIPQPLGYYPEAGSQIGPANALLVNSSPAGMNSALAVAEAQNGSVINVASPSSFTNSNNIPVWFSSNSQLSGRAIRNPQEWGAVADYVSANFGTTAGGNIVTCPTCSFNSATDIGKTIFVSGAGTYGFKNWLVATITGVTNSTTVTVSQNATTSQLATGLGAKVLCTVVDGSATSCAPITYNSTTYNGSGYPASTTVTLAVDFPPAMGNLYLQGGAPQSTQYNEGTGYTNQGMAFTRLAWVTTTNAPTVTTGVDGGPVTNGTVTLSSGGSGYTASFNDVMIGGTCASGFVCQPPTFHAVVASPPGPVTAINSVANANANGQGIFSVAPTLDFSHGLGGTGAAATTTLGTLPSGSYSFKIAYSTPYGVTLPSAESATITSVSGAITIPSPTGYLSTNAQCWYAYITSTPGSGWQQQGGCQPLGLPYTQSMPLVSGAAPPTTTTTVNVENVPGPDIPIEIPDNKGLRVNFGTPPPGAVGINVYGGRTPTSYTLQASYSGLGTTYFTYPSTGPTTTGAALNSYQATATCTTNSSGALTGTCTVTNPGAGYIYDALARVETVGTGGYGTDNTAALQACLTASSNEGIECRVPSGNYLFNTSTLLISEGTRLVGQSSQTTVLVCGPSVINPQSVIWFGITPNSGQYPDCMAMAQGPQPNVILSDFHIQGVTGSLAPPQTKVLAQNLLHLDAEGTLTSETGGTYNQWTIDNVGLDDTWGDGISLDGHNDGGEYCIGGCFNQFMTIKNIASNAGAGGIGMTPPMDSARIYMKNANEQIAWVGGQVNGSSSDRGVGIWAAGAVQKFINFTIQTVEYGVITPYNAAQSLSFDYGWCEQVSKLYTDMGPLTDNISFEGSHMAVCGTDQIYNPSAIDSAGIYATNHYYGNGILMSPSSGANHFRFAHNNIQGIVPDAAINSHSAVMDLHDNMYNGAIGANLFQRFFTEGITDTATPTAGGVLTANDITSFQIVGDACANPYKWINGVHQPGQTITLYAASSYFCFTSGGNIQLLFGYAQPIEVCGNGSVQFTENDIGGTQTWVAGRVSCPESNLYNVKIYDSASPSTGDVTWLQNVTTYGFCQVHSLYSGTAGEYFSSRDCTTAPGSNQYTHWVASGAAALGSETWVLISTDSNASGGSTVFSKAVAVPSLNLSGTTAPLLLNGSAGTSGQCPISGGAGVTPSWGSCVGSAPSTLVATFTTTAVTSETVTVTGLSSSGHCMFPSATNATAAAMTGIYLSSPTTNSVTFNHPATAGGTFNIFCTTN